MGYLYFKGDKNYPKIIEDINNAIKFYPSKKYKSAYKSNASKYSMRAKVYKEMGNYQQAIKDLETAINLDPDDVIDSSGVNPDDEAPPGTTWGKKDFDEIIKRFPGDFRGYVFRGLYYSFFAKFKRENYEPAVNDYKKAISLNPKSALSNFLFGKIYNNKAFWSFKENEKAEDYKNAITALTKAIQLNPQMLDAYYMRAETYLELKEYQLAIKDFDKAIELDPDNGVTYHDRGIANQNLGNYFAAIDDFSEAIEAKSQINEVCLGNAYENRANVYVMLGNYKDAIKDYTKEIELLIGNCLLQMNISKFRLIYPEYNNVSDEILARKLHSKFWSNLKYEDFAARFLMTENKTISSPAIAYLYINRGDAYLNSGYYKKAIGDYERAIKIFPEYSIERWRLFTTSSNGGHNIDIKSVTYLQNGNIRFWTKIVYNKPQEKRVASSFQNFEISCSSRMIKTISIVDYDSDGNAINSGNTFG